MSTPPPQMLEQSIMKATGGMRVFSSGESGSEDLGQTPACSSHLLCPEPSLWGTRITHPCLRPDTFQLQSPFTQLGGPGEAGRDL